MAEERYNISKIKVSKGENRPASNLAEVLPELSPETEVVYAESQSRQTGTGYRNDIYRICGSDDAIIIRHNDGYVTEDVSVDSVSVSKGYFAEKREYGRACGKLSRRYGVPFEVALVLGTEDSLYSRLADALKAAKEGAWLTDVEEYIAFLYSEGRDEQYSDVFASLSAGINRRKVALKYILGDEFYNELGIYGMGQVHSERLARYVLTVLE